MNTIILGSQGIIMNNSAIMSQMIRRAPTLLKKNYQDYQNILSRKTKV